jgi:hypothetical protein
MMLRPTMGIMLCLAMCWLDEVAAVLMPRPRPLPGGLQPVRPDCTALLTKYRHAPCSSSLVAQARMSASLEQSAAVIDVNPSGAGARRGFDDQPLCGAEHGGSSPEDAWAS